MTRIVSWNCNQGLLGTRGKAARLLDRQPDIAVVIECADDVIELGPLRRIDWTGQYPRKGLAVFARPELDGHIDPDHDPSREYFVPVRFESIDFSLLAVWARHYGGTEGRAGYGRTHEAFAYYADFLADADLVIGDFNDNVRWDTPRRRHYATTDALLRDAGFANLYYERTGEAPGGESIGSLSFRWHVDEPYLIDHAFLRADRIGSVREFAIGESASWIDVSDHAPLVLDLALPVPMPGQG
jgi:hypothetical protein